MRQKKPATQLSGGLRSSTRLPTSATANIEEVVATLAVLEKDQQHENADMERQQEQERNISERPKIPEKKVVCPFSQAREGAKALCDWGERATIRSLQQQLRKIRFKSLPGCDHEMQIGFDYTHREMDPLWETEEIKDLLVGRPKLKSKKDHNRAYYQKRKDARLMLKSLLETGQISKAEYDQQAKEMKVNVGYYKLQEIKEKLAEQIAHFRERIHLIYGSDSEDGNGFVYKWPTVPSVEAYLTIVCLCLPTDILAVTDDPTTFGLQIKIKTALLSDNDYLAEWVDATKRVSIAKVFIPSCDLVNAKFKSMYQRGPCCALVDLINEVCNESGSGDQPGACRVEDE